MEETVQPEIQMDQPIQNEYSTPKSGRWRKALMVVGAASLALICLCVGGALLLGFMSYRTAEENRDQWLAVSEAYMEAMAEQEIDKAYALFAAEARREFRRSELQVLVDGPFGVLFTNYHDLEITGWNVEFNTSGTLAEIEGLVNYSDGDTGSFEATLRKKGESWGLFWFEVNVSPERFKEFSNATRGDQG